MSWIFVDGIDEGALYDALDLAATTETPDPHDLGTTFRWQDLLSNPVRALYLRSMRWSWTRLWVRTRLGLCGCREAPDVSRVWSWSMR
jgi:hypothetical protein